MSRQGRLERAERIRQMHVDQADELLSAIERPEEITAVIQVGVGSWDEGPALLKHLPGRMFLGIEPLSRYQAVNYPGHIVRGVAFRRFVCNVEIADRYGKTSLWSPYPRKGCEVETVDAYRIDEIVWMVGTPSRADWLTGDPSHRYLLWLDCEGGEADAILGACMTMRQVHAVIIEHRDAPDPGWCSTREVFELLGLHGFSVVKSFERRGGVFDSVLMRRGVVDGILASPPSTS